MAQQSAAVGGGIMGAGIAQVLARNGYDGAVREINEELADEARTNASSRATTDSRTPSKAAISPRTRWTRCSSG